jgi:hypothetical protein
MNAREKLIFLLGKGVLQILESQEEWNSDTPEDIAMLAYDLGLAKTGEDGLFEIIQ